MNRLSRACLIWCCIVFDGSAHDAKIPPNTAIVSPVAPSKATETNPLKQRAQEPQKSSHEIPPWLSAQLTLENPSPFAQQLFERLAQKMGLKSETIIIKQSPNLLEKYRYHALAQGNILIFDTSQAELPLDEFSFLLAHELAHIKHHDTNKQIAAHLLSALGKITLAGIALQIARTPHTLLTTTYITAGYFLFSLGISKEAIRRYKLYQEKQADLTAINTLGTKRGAIAWLTRGTQTNKKIHDTLLQHGLKNSGSRVDKVGNNLDDTTHPALTERIAYINAALPNEYYP
ncbi:hypothetical protein CVU75_02010 [Candidatus Dependentiae bacterium HGW-Dependentiae-1]|nr:MAG: hypothetical protein CVU75_02010 [Candidatus Dependentiae bacterium HGW-Dependentiae-1]